MILALFVPLVLYVGTCLLLGSGDSSIPYSKNSEYTATGGVTLDMIFALETRGYIPSPHHPPGFDRSKSRSKPKLFRRDSHEINQV